MNNIYKNEKISDICRDDPTQKNSITQPAQIVKTLIFGYNEEFLEFNNYFF